MKTRIWLLSFLTLKPFFIFGCYLWLSDFSIDFFQYCIVFTYCMLLTVVQRFDKFAFSLCWRNFCLSPKQYCTCINQPTSCRCSSQEMFWHIGVRPEPKNKQNPWKSFWTNPFLIKMKFFSMQRFFTGKMKLIKKFSQVPFKLFVKHFW